MPFFIKFLLKNRPNIRTKNGVGHFLYKSKSPIFSPVFASKYSIPNRNLQPSELLTWANNDAGVTIRGKYNGIAVTYFFSGALKASISAWGSLNVSAESTLKPSVTSFVRLSADLYGVIDINGKISIYNGSSEPIPENSNKELNGVLTYIL